MDSLKENGYKAVFLGVGLQDPTAHLGKEVYKAKNVWNSKTFLRPLNYRVKKHRMNNSEKN